MTQPATIDRLSALLERCRFRAHLFHQGALCGVNRFEAAPGRAFLHVLRRGALEVRHRGAEGRRQRLRIDQPSLLLYPRAWDHTFSHALAEGSDLVCATLAFDGEAAHPLVRALPPTLVLPLDRIAGIEHTLALLFAEAEAVRCGQRLLADRLFEVLLVQVLRWLLDHPEAAAIDRGLLFGLSDPPIARALTALHEQPGESWTLPRMAAAAGLSRSSFAARFRAALGQTPADYLAGWRLMLAQSALRAGQAPKRIAAELGLADDAALSRLFRRRLGLPPRAWLRAQGTDQP